MTFLFKTKAVALFLLPFVVNSTHVERKIYDLEASNKFIHRIELNWKSAPLSDGEIIEIQRSLHDKNNYASLKLSDVQKANKSPYYTDTDNLKPQPIRYDYRICTFKNGVQFSDWSNIAVGSLVPVAQQGDYSMKVTCSATLSLNEIRNIKGGYQLFYAHQHDCGQVHEPQVFLSKDAQLDDTDKLLRTLSQTDSTLHVLTGKYKTEDYEYWILKMGNQVDNQKMK